jgi:hypothetical protein
MVWPIVERNTGYQVKKDPDAEALGLPTFITRFNSKELHRCDMQVAGCVAVQCAEAAHRRPGAAVASGIQGASTIHCHDMSAVQVR